MLKSKNVLFFMTGSIAAYKACELLSLLVKSGSAVKVVCTEDTFNFVGASTLEGLTGNTPITNTFAEGGTMAHIDLGRWCDLAIVCPITANTLNKMSAGIADNMVLATLLAFDFNKPLFLCPAMNTRMLNHPTTQASLSKISGWGVNIVSASSGALACGEVGEGRLEEPLEIFRIIKKLIEQSAEKIERDSQSLSSLEDSKKPLALVTYGGTQEPIDSVRFITNFSTGKTGLKIVDKLVRSGYNVIALHGKNSPVKKHAAVTNISFGSFTDIDSKIQTICSAQNPNLVLHAAAISDYSLPPSDNLKNSPKTEPNFKLSSEHDELTLKLKKNKKIVNFIKTYSGASTKVVAFKLTDCADQRLRSNKVQQIFDRGAVDMVVHNDLSEIKQGHHVFTVYNKLKSLYKAQTVESLIDNLLLEINKNENALESTEKIVLDKKLTLKNDSRFEVKL